MNPTAPHAPRLAEASDSQPKPNRLRTLVRRTLAVALIFLVGTLILAGGLWFYYHPATESQYGIVYAERHDQPLEYDVIRPRRPNGAAVLCLISGSWRSSDAPIDPWPAAPLLRRGFTLILVRHRSQPEATVPEIVADIHRAVRHIRHHASGYGIDPDRIGVSGGSSGGHLSLLLATRGGPGLPHASDPVDRESSRVQAAAVFFPVTDLFDLGDSTENLHDGGPPKSYVAAFGMPSRDPEPWLPVARELSPIHHISENLPPLLIYHGTADTLVPFDQSTRFRDRARELGIREDRITLIPRPGKEHGWPSMVLDVYAIADWYEQTLR